MKSINKKSPLLFFITFLLLSGFHFLITYFVNREGYDPYFSLFFGFALALIFSFFPVSYSSYRDEWIYSNEIITNNTFTDLKHLLISKLAESSWKITNQKETDNQLKLEFRLDEKIWQKNERLTIVIQKLGAEWKLTVKSDGGVSYKRQGLEPLKNNVLKAHEKIEEIITRQD
ncbi:hypothetical protein [Peijinzhouia sedimentorum]